MKPRTVRCWRGSMLIVMLAAASAAAAPSMRVVIDDAQRSALGLATTEIGPAQDAGTLDATGRVLDPMTLVDAVSARGAARSTAARARQELERVRQLARGQDNASQRDVEIAEDAERQARIARDAADARLAAAFGAALSDRSDLEALAGRMARGELALARVELAPGEVPVGEPSTIELFALDGGARALAATLVGPAPTVDPTVQGRGWLLRIEAAPPPAGAALAAKLGFPERAAKGFLVPREALLRQAGRVWVYVELEPDTFARRELALIRAQDEGWLATGPLAAGDRVVVRGAQELLAKELAPATADAAKD